MSREEFLRVTAYITAASDKPLSQDRLEAYFDLLGDLPYEILLTAAKRVVLEHPWATFPSIAELRKAATESTQGTIATLTAAEAWALAWKCIGNTDPEVEGSFARASFDLPAIVIEAIRTFGLMAMCYGKEPIGVVRAQFTAIYEQLAARAARTALFPAALTQAIQRKPLPAPVASTLAAIGTKGKL